MSFFNKDLGGGFKPLDVIFLLICLGFGLYGQFGKNKLMLGIALLAVTLWGVFRLFIYLKEGRAGQFSKKDQPRYFYLRIVRIAVGVIITLGLGILLIFQALR